jgi:hypothetical protein
VAQPALGLFVDETQLSALASRLEDPGGRAELAERIAQPDAAQGTPAEE